MLFRSPSNWDSSSTPNVLDNGVWWNGTVPTRNWDERALGLMNRKKIDKNKGMLFVYHFPSAPQFWMKNTLISLDILFSSYDGRIIKIFENVPKMTEKKVTAGDGVSFVLEINSGLVEEFEIDASWIMNFTDFFETTKPFC